MKLQMGWVVILIAAIGLAGCGSDQSTPRPAGVALGSEFQLRAGESAAMTAENLQITFVKVTEDSRCPSNVQCIWAGQAKVVLTAVAAGMPRDIELTLGGGSPSAASASFGAYTVELRNLEPYPDATRQIKPGDTIATLLVTKQ
jgi:hypothetical protein